MKSKVSAEKIIRFMYSLFERKCRQRINAKTHWKSKAGGRTQNVYICRKL